MNLMTAQDYQLLLNKYDVSEGTLWYYALGLAGESGEVVDKIKKFYRDGTDEQFKTRIINELGDALWYLTRIATWFGSDLEEVMAANIRKLEDRLTRNVLHGSGDNR